MTLHQWHGFLQRVDYSSSYYSFDVTNQLTRPERHIKLAVGLDYLDACPVRGMRRGGQEQMHAQMQSAPLLQNQLPSQEQ